MKRTNPYASSTPTKKIKSTNYDFSAVLQTVAGMTAEQLVRLMEETTKYFSICCQQVLENVPIEVWRVVFRYCTRKTVLTLGCVSQQFSRLADQLCAEIYPHLCCVSDLFLRKFTMLKKLKIKQRHITAPTLSLLTNLECLRLGEGTRSDLQIAVPELTGLLELSCNRPLDFPNLFTLTNLTALRLARGFYRQDPCALLPHLRTLSLDNLPGTDISPLWTSLTSLSVSYFNPPSRARSKEASRVLGTFTNLTKLRCMLGSNRKFCPDMLQNLTNLRSLTLSPCLPVGCFTHLVNLKSTTAFTIRPPCCNLTQLTFLEKFNCEGSGSASKYVSHLTNLRVLKAVDRCPSSCLPVSLEKLFGADCHRVGRVSHLTNLTYLAASYVSPEGLSTLTNLRSLTVWDRYKAGPKASDVETLTNLTKLCCPAMVIPDEVVEGLPHLLKVRRRRGDGTTQGRFDLVESLESNTTFSSDSFSDHSSDGESFVSVESEYESVQSDSDEISDDTADGF